MSQSAIYPRYLGDFYYGMILPCIKQLATIRNWATFCGFDTRKDGCVGGVFTHFATSFFSGFSCTTNVVVAPLQN